MTAETLGLAIGILTVGALLLAAVRRMGLFLFKVSHFIDDVTGERKRPGVPARPGVVEQVSELRDRQEEIATVAQRAADDVAAVRHELTRNGGDSTKDVIHNAERSAKLAEGAASRTEALMRRHMLNGEEIMAVGVHNDAQVIAAIKALGGDVGPLRDYPPVDTGEDI